jgi:type III pantothenate kinase
MRILVLAIGNTSLFGGVFSGAQRVSSFRLPNTALVNLSRQVRGKIDQAIVCSVVPAETPDAVRFIRRSWNLDARLLTFDAAHGLKLRYRQPGQLGSDRIAAALGARALYPRSNVIVVDCGTATTVTALRSDGTLLGGAILPGLALWPEMLALRTALLPRVKLRRPRVALARSTEDAIASGVFFGHIGAIRETVAQVQAEAFGRARAVVVGTGGHAQRFAREKLFTALEPNLILQGLREFAVREAAPNISV